MFCKQIALDLEMLGVSVLGSSIDPDGSLRIRTNLTYFDEIRIKANGDYDYHVLINIAEDRWQEAKIPNLLKGNQEMLDEFTFWLQKFRPEKVLMNFYGLQQWPNAHFHLFAGKRNPKCGFWKVIDEAAEARKADRFGFYSGKNLRDYKHASINGSRGIENVSEEVLAVDITTAIREQNQLGLNYKKLVRVINNLTGRFQPGIKPAKRRAFFADGHDGYGSLVLLPNKNTEFGYDVYYVLKEHR